MRRMRSRRQDDQACRSRIKMRFAWTLQDGNDAEGNSYVRDVQERQGQQMTSGPVARSTRPFARAGSDILAHLKMRDGLRVLDFRRDFAGEY